MIELGIKAMENGWLPDCVTRYGIRQNAKARLTQFGQSPENQQIQLEQFINYLSSNPIAVSTREANEQHYELPASFFELVLGPNLKYSSCIWHKDATSLKQAEEDMLKLTCQRAELTDGQNILELGCGWGSLTLWMAMNYPNSTIHAISNSKFQREYILQQASLRGIKNITVETVDINQFDTSKKFDRIVSIEMFEHLRNYKELFAKIHSWLLSNGKLFVHIFCHKDLAYHYETEGSDNWMGKYFFTGGIMPSRDLLLRFSEHLKVDRQWLISGENYQKTAEAWLANMDTNKLAIMRIFNEFYGPKQSKIWFNRWRTFFMACAEVFGFDGGDEWLVTHIIFSKQIPN